jgi:hypothetical protein
MDLKLILHDTLFILGNEPKDSFKNDDVLVYIKDPKIANLLRENEYVDPENINDYTYSIAKIGELYNKASNIYFRLDEKNKEKFQNINDDIIINSIIPMITITYLILYQIKRILKIKALGHIAKDIEKDELNIAWNLFQYLLKGMPAGLELINKINKDEFDRLYLAMSLIK